MSARSVRLLSTLLLLGALAVPTWGDDSGKHTACQDTNNITWFTPGKFEEARKAAQTQKRILMVKGIAFGIDAVGAKCATKGCW